METGACSFNAFYGHPNYYKNQAGGLISRRTMDDLTDKLSSLKLPSSDKDANTNTSVSLEMLSFKFFESNIRPKYNLLQGLELHKDIFNAAEQAEIVQYVFRLQDKSKRSRDRAYLELEGERTRIQFGCYFDYKLRAIDPRKVVDPIPPRLKDVIKKMVEWHVLPSTCIPDSCIINIYDEKDCIPPHTVSFDFVRPFCTVSFSSECPILFGSKIKPVERKEKVFEGSTSVTLPVGSVLVLKGDGADRAKHCISAVHKKRISITFRKMAPGMVPNYFKPDPELLSFRPLEVESQETHRRLISLTDTPMGTLATHAQERRIRTTSTEQTQRPMISSGAPLVPLVHGRNPTFSRTQRAMLQHLPLNYSRTGNMEVSGSNTFVHRIEDFPPLG